MRENSNHDSNPHGILNFFFIEQIEGSKIGYQLMRTKVFRALNATLNPNLPPACQKFPKLSDEFWGCLARQYSQTIYHPSGTLKMGPRSDRKLKFFLYENFFKFKNTF